MPYIRECIVTTVDRQGSVHIAPLGIIAERDGWVIAPFRPSTTLDNLQAVPFAVANYVDDVRSSPAASPAVATGRRCRSRARRCRGVAAALAHSVLAVAEVADDPVRPRFLCRVVGEGMHAPFTGLNRAKAAVLELAILVSRLERLPRDKIEAELAYLSIAIDKTAGEAELEAWGWLMERVTAHLTAGAATGGGLG